jgi:hypothetical protein
MGIGEEFFGEPGLIAETDQVGFSDGATGRHEGVPHLEVIPVITVSEHARRTHA